jgi:hypothetical protein
MVYCALKKSSLMTQSFAYLLRSWFGSSGRSCSRASFGTEKAPDICWHFRYPVNNNSPPRVDIDGKVLVKLLKENSLEQLLCSAGRHAETRACRADPRSPPWLPRTHVTKPLLPFWAGLFDPSFNFRDLAAGRTISSQHSKYRKSLTKGLFTVQDVGQITIRPVEVM